MATMSRPARTLTAALFVASVAHAQPVPPAHLDTTPSRAIPARATTLGGQLTVPRGVQVTKWGEVRGARAMVVGPDGSVYVSTPRSGEIHRLRDTNGDGVADGATVVLAGLNRPHGMAFHKGKFYVANTDAVQRFALDAQGVPTGAGETIARYDAGGGHWTRSITFGRDGKMYVSIGSTCNVCIEKTPDRASVMVYDETGGNGRVYASGLRNAVGMAWHPGTQALWVTQHERDMLKPDHQDLPQEEINILVDGGDYGWPYCHGARVPNPEFNDQARCNRTVAPALRMQAHSAPLGITFLDKATALPREFRGDALVAFHGSWNRDQPTGAKVVRLRIKDGKPVSYEDFIAGWQDASGKRWGRPVDFAVLADGSVLVSDDMSGGLWRVTATRDAATR